MCFTSNFHPSKHIPNPLLHCHKSEFCLFLQSQQGFHLSSALFNVCPLFQSALLCFNWKSSPSYCDTSCKQVARWGRQVCTNAFYSASGIGIGHRHRASINLLFFRPFSQFAKITITSMSVYDMLWWELPNVVAEYEAVLHLLITLGLRGALKQDLWKCEFCWILFYFVWSYLIIFYILSH